MAYHGKVLSHEYVRRENLEIEELQDLDYLYQEMDSHISSRFKASLIRKLKLRQLYVHAGKMMFDVSIQVRGPEHEIRMYYLTFIFSTKPTTEESEVTEDDT